MQFIGLRRRALRVSGDCDYNVIGMGLFLGTWATGSVPAVLRVLSWGPGSLSSGTGNFLLDSLGTTGPEPG